MEPCETVSSELKLEEVAAVANHGATETIDTTGIEETIDCVVQQPDSADVGTVAISSDMIGQLETATDESGLKQQVIIVTSADGSLTGNTMSYSIVK